MSDGHIPVLLSEVIEALSPRDGAHYVDGTFGGGGYARAVLDSAKCSVLGIDQDPDAIARGQLMALHYEGRLTLALGRYSEMERLLADAGHTRTDGVVLDLGISSFQIDQAERGFSFRLDGPLDMRMSLEGPSAADVVNTMDEAELARILATLGEERFARRVARAIVAARPLSRTGELADVVAKALGPQALRQPIHPATRTFQALRLYVNDELGELTRGLEAAERVLNTHGRLVVVAFHSLEDRIVKQFLTERSRPRPQGSRHLPERASAQRQTFKLLSSRPRTPGAAELANNPRARSAKLRVAERTSAAA
ncbi:MAG TPA: 16S rRNA (cytosine(1402)-N(4))-methyltransferase RsmH [Rhizomicrobium sp.]|nr:16S rRNA (cytosine(1402)-N(4))-methyltransferase RsmH [Rhizomicrobium sp.]